MPLNVTGIGAEWLTVRTGGLNRYTEGLSRALSDAGVAQRWLVMGDEDLSPAANVTVKAVASPRSGMLTRWRGVRREWNDLTPLPSLVASHFALYAYPICRRLARTPHVVHFHGPWADESTAEGSGGVATRIKRHIERSVYATGDRFVTLSQAFADVLADRYAVDPGRIEIVPGGVDVERFDTGLSRADARRRLGWEVDRPTILCVRRLVNRMGLEQLIEAMQAVAAVQPETQLLVAGKGPLGPKLTELIERLNLGRSVRLLGFVPDDDLPTAYRAADLSIVPTQLLEGFGLIIAESLAAGTPALVTPVGGMPEVVQPLDGGLVLSGSGVADLAQGVTQALSGELRLPSDKACQAYSRDRFAWPVIAERLLEVYRGAIDSYG